MIKIGIIGATGYSGVELLSLLLKHDKVSIEALYSSSSDDVKISEVYPFLNKIFDKKCKSLEFFPDNCDVVFSCMPSGLSQKFAKKALDKNVTFIDLGSDFRIKEKAVYEKWYENELVFPELHELAVYGLPELFRSKIKGSKIIANPGCYPTSIALGAAPILSKNLNVGKIIIDSKSGVTGAGRALSDSTHFPGCNEAFGPYKVLEHRHTPEIAQTLSSISGKEEQVIFVPHLLPINRGIISTVYLALKDLVDIEEVYECYTKFYENEKFIRLKNLGKTANLRDVKYSNYCDISLHLDKESNTLVVVSAIDNMVKGAAGQAIQNMNILFNIPEDTGLNLVPRGF